MHVTVVSLGTVALAGSPAIHYPPGAYEVSDDVEAALRAQGVLAPADAEPDAPARKGKGA